MNHPRCSPRLVRGPAPRRWIRLLVLLSLIVPAARSQPNPFTPARDVLGMPLSAAIRQIAAAPSAASKTKAATAFLARVRAYGYALMEDSTLCLVYSGKARRVAVPSDLNGWNPAADSMVRIEGTSLFYRTMSLDPGARFEYKLYVDSTWLLDPLNRQVAAGGYGMNSEIWMPRYRPSPDIVERAGIPRGRVDSLLFASAILGRKHPVLVYTPPGFTPGSGPYPTVYVLDGGEYLSLGKMNIVLDNLIAERRIRPVIAVFMDPRTDPADSRTSKRMEDYALSQTFLRCLSDELPGFLRQRYPIASGPGETAILGASLGGLTATYASALRPDVFGLCAAQSPAYQILRDSIFTLIPASPRVRARFYIETGTLSDAREQSLRMAELLTRLGYDVFYQEVPEGHNWVHWRARLADILIRFWSAR